jgi:hypothetical protein
VRQAPATTAHHLHIANKKSLRHLEPSRAVATFSAQPAAGRPVWIWNGRISLVLVY